MKIAKIDQYDLTNTPGTDSACCSVWFQGCNIHCKSCHNKELWDGNGGTHIEPIDVAYEICCAIQMSDIRSVALLGGEPLLQPESELVRLIELVRAVSRYKLEIWLYTGYDFRNIPKSILHLVDVVKAGKYDESQRSDKWLGFLSSSNQKLYKKRENKWMEVAHYAD